MVDNVNLGRDSHFNHVIDVAKTTTGRGKVADQQRVAPGIHLSVDMDAKVSGSFESGAGRLISVNYTSETAPKWVALHINLGEVSLEDKAVLGIVVRSTAKEAVAMRVCLRSGTQNFVDEFFTKHIVAFSEPSTHLDILKLDDLPAHHPRGKVERDLIVFFPPTDSAFTISDIRLFIA
ncbi:hypothetical protein [Falsirhodobacter halotolerans]|uniref:hypothetical protein n=1 Tax=Falsirhodobacter halotolerans TaxID=1146892 RepID=UPI001FD1B393|nr:hypothetical protein [Falsirhodobacter halotolerans]MCJ8139623.1 hypothetical protein [Falsirhodobacter halotolerans]